MGDSDSSKKFGFTDVGLTLIWLCGTDGGGKIHTHTHTHTHTHIFLEQDYLKNSPSEKFFI